MSRSIHTTRRTLRELAAAVQAKREDADEEFKEAWLEFHRKKRIKRSVAAERRDDLAPLVSTAAEAIPVRLLDERPSVMHGASVEDIKEILARLPEGARHGIAEVRLSFGLEEQEEHAKQARDDDFRDPILCRPGGTLVPGVYVGHVLGSFSRRSGLISVYAYVVDPTATILPEGALRLYLRLTALTTLIHEVAHHHDTAMRVRRGRWLADKEKNAEAYAEKMTRLWTTHFLPRYLHETYGADVASFLDWIHAKVGAQLPLRFFLDEAETFLPITYLFKRWLEELTEIRPISESRLSFAQWIVYADRYTESLTIVDQLLAERADWREAQVLRAQALQHLKRFDEAYEQAIRILNAQPTCVAALKVRSHVYEERQDWQNLLLSSDTTLALTQSPADKRNALILRAVALCALRRDAELEQTFGTLSTAGLRAPIEEVREWIFRRAGREMSRLPLV